MKQFFSALFLFTTVFSFAQTFEGTLTYKLDIEVSEKLSKMGMTKEMLIDKMKQEGTWSDSVKTSYKNGNYYTLLNNNPKSWSVYKAEANKIYSFDTSEYCVVTDASIDTEQALTGKIPTIVKLDTAVLVNGTTCSMVRVKWKSGTYDYYFSSTQLPVNPVLFDRHIYDGWAGFLKISNALPLKIVKTTKGVMTVTMTLVSVKTERVNESLFSVPVLVDDEQDPGLLGSSPNTRVMRIQK